jgi:hypothetical protein
MPKSIRKLFQAFGHSLEERTVKNLKYKSKDKW